MVSRELLMLIGLVSLLLFIELTFHDRTFCEGKISVKFFLHAILFCAGYTFLVNYLFHLIIDKSSKEYSILTIVLSVLFMLLFEAFHCINTKKKRD